MTKAEDNVFPYITVIETAAPANPASGQRKWYIDPTTHLPILVDSSGAKVPFGAGAGLLARTFWKPATQQNLSTASATIVDADATNLAVTFLAPPSGAVIVRLEGGVYNANGWGEFGIREATTVLAVARVSAVNAGGGAMVRSFLITGLAAGSSHTYKFGYSAGSGGGTLNLYVQTDDPATNNTSVGPASIEVWAA